MTPVQQRAADAKPSRRPVARLRPPVIASFFARNACAPRPSPVIPDAGARRKAMAVAFHGKVAIVTGAGSGLGRCHALGLAERGAKVVVNDLGRNGEPSENALRVVEEIRRAGGAAMADPADVTDFDQVAAMAARAEAEWGRIDILVNNAGVLSDK